MIDVIVPVNERIAANAVFNCLAELADNTDIPLRMIVCGQGGTKTDWTVVRDFLDTLRDEQGLHYGLFVHERKKSKPADCVRQGLGLIKHEYVFVLRPDVLIRDNQWFSKMVAPIQKAPYVGGVFLPAEFSGSATLPPNPLMENSEIYPTSAVLTTRAHIEFSGAHYRGDFFDQSFQSGLVTAGSVRWIHPGVRFEVHRASAWAQG